MLELTHQILMILGNLVGAYFLTRVANAQLAAAAVFARAGWQDSAGEVKAWFFILIGLVSLVGATCLVLKAIKLLLEFFKG